MITENSFFDTLTNEEETLKIVVAIMNGLSRSSTELQKYLFYWEKYKMLWEMDKDAFIRRYGKGEDFISNILFFFFPPFSRTENLSLRSQKS